MGSSRLPGKSMMHLAGEPLVGRIIERVKRCREVNTIVLAIPDTENDRVLEELGNQHSIEVFIGSENDLVDRYYKADLKYKADFIVRIPADNTTPQFEEIDRIINHHVLLGRPGFSSNLSVINDSGYPDGIGAEIFDFCLLENVYLQEADPLKREHVHLNFYNYDLNMPVDEDWCPISTIKCPRSIRRPDLVLDVNTLEQYTFMCELYDALYPSNPEFTISDIITWYDSEYNGPIKSKNKN